MDIKSLYKDIIVDHNRSPRNFRRIARCTHSARGFNPLCGDKLSVYLVLDGDTVTDIAFEGSGCAISMASASLMTEAVVGKSETEARTLFEKMRNVLTGKDPAVDFDTLGKLGALAGVREYPSRVKCASLSWHALKSALDGDNSASTE